MITGGPGGSGPLFAQSFIFPGIQQTVESGLSQTNTSGATGILSNPANILRVDHDLQAHKAPQEQKAKKSQKINKYDKRAIETRGIEAYGDLSLLNINYSYSRSGYNATQISQTAPPITLGMVWRPRSEFAVGLLLIPRPDLGSGIDVKNLAQEQPGEVVVVNANLKSASMTTGLGISAELTPKISAGISVVEYAEQNSISAISVINPGAAPLVQMKFDGSFFQFILGSRFSPNDKTLIGASYRTAVEKKYSGSMSLLGADEISTDKVGYLPGTFAVGVEQDFARSTFFSEIRHESWSAGKNIARAGGIGGAESTAYNDVFIFIAGGRTKITQNQTASVSLGNYPANVGFGSRVDANFRTTADGPPTGGVEFGDFDALDRLMFSGSYRLNRANGYLQGGLNFITGGRVVPSGHKNAGNFKLSVITFSGGGTLAF